MQPPCFAATRYDLGYCIAACLKALLREDVSNTLPFTGVFLDKSDQAVIYAFICHA
ncbi:hypothetical protein ACFL2Q_10905 [Thermodesulfobacteriota bacterium]